MLIRNKTVGMDNPPYIIAEISANHNGSKESAKQLINVAKNAGADAVKLQTYTADTITLNSDSADFVINEGLWQGQTLYELYKQAYTPWEWHKDLFDYARALDLTIFSSPFDKTAVDLLEDLNTPAYKIASFEAIDLPLIKYVAQTGRPMIISTGMADLTEIEEAIETARAAGCQDLAILHCVSSYPAPAEDYNLKTIIDMQQRFNIPVGLSDHTLDNTTAIAAVALGACIVEKHFTLDRSRGGPDDSFSLEPTELTALCRDTKTAWQAMGHVNYALKSSEQDNIKFRRSLYFVKDMQVGEIIDDTCIRSVRPGYGLPPKYFDSLIGKRVAQSVSFGRAVTWEMLSTD